MFNRLVNEAINKSHPTRGAWIEIKNNIKELLEEMVAPHPGCVD